MVRTAINSHEKEEMEMSIKTLELTRMTTMPTVKITPYCLLTRVIDR